MLGPSLFRDEAWLHQHARGILNFYYPTCVDHRFGGYVAQLSDLGGHVYNSEQKLVVSTARFIFTFSAGELLGGPDWCHSAAHHGVDFLIETHRQDDGSYPWLLSGREVADSLRTCYGHAFVLLAFATAAKADIPRARAHIGKTFEIVDKHFWESDQNLCKGKLDENWTETEAYRGQNANMHMCEALIAAYEATDDEMYLSRAYTIAERLALKLADKGDGLVWEHYTPDWEHNWGYNRHLPGHTFRPWGYQPGHLVAWTKLLLTLDEYVDADWLIKRARHFFDAAVEHGWDDERGGFVYNFDRDGEVIVDDKYYWELCEGFAAAARLAEATGEDKYWDWYDLIWEYAWENLINRKYGNWYTRVTADNVVPDDIDDSPSTKAGYHSLGCCYDVIRTAHY